MPCATTVILTSGACETRFWSSGSGDGSAGGGSADSGGSESSDRGSCKASNMSNLRSFLTTYLTGLGW